GGQLGDLVVPELLLDHRHAVGLGKAGPLVDGAERQVVARLGDHLVEDALVERAGIGEPCAAIADDAHTDTLALRRDEVLDLTLVDPHLGLAATADVRLDLLTGQRALDDEPADAGELVESRAGGGARVTHAAPP